MALAITMTPIIARSAEVQLRVVPGGLREASLALGASLWRTVVIVVLPTAKAGSGDRPDPRRRPRGRRDGTRADHVGRVDVLERQPVQATR